MQLRRFGSTALQIAPVALGTVNFSWLTDEADSFAILDAAFEAGVNLVDTSDNYNAGKTEALLGRWFALGGGRREKTVLASKVYSPPMEWGSRDPEKRSGSWVGPNQRGLSAKHIREACETSLTRLNTDYLDLYQMHHVDRSARWEEIWQAMELLIQQGKVLYVGSSNFAGWHIAQAQESGWQGARRGGAGVRAERLQPHQTHRGAGGTAGDVRLRHGLHPLQPAGRRAAWRAARGQRAGPAGLHDRHRAGAAIPEPLRRPGRGSRIGGAGLGGAPGRASPPR